MTSQPTRAVAIGVLALALTFGLAGIVPDRDRAYASMPPIIQTATPALPTLAPALAAPQVAPAPEAPAPVAFDLAPVSAPENAAQTVAPPIVLEAPAPIAPITIDQSAPQFVPKAPLDAPNAVPQCAPGVDNPICDLPVLVLSNDAPESAPVITDRDRAYSKARTR